MKNLPIIFLHGALGSQDQMKALQHLVTPTPSYILNFEGHGGRPSGQPFSTKLFEENILTLMHEKEIPCAHFFGYSMGGYVALSLALNHPEKVGKIITLATKFDWTPESAAKEVKMLDPEKIEEKVPHFAQSLKERHAPLDWKELLHKTANMMIDLGNRAGLSDKSLTNISNEVLICRGSEDRMVSDEESKNTVSLIPNARFYSIPGGKHPIERVDLNTLSDLIKSFLY